MRRRYLRTHAMIVARAVPEVKAAGLAVRFMRLVDSGYATPQVI